MNETLASLLVAGLLATFAPKVIFESRRALYWNRARWWKDEPDAASVGCARIIGVVLLIGAFLIWSNGSRVPAPAAPPVPVAHPNRS